MSRPISSTASHAVDVACFKLEKLEYHPNQPVVRHFNTPNHSVSDIIMFLSFHANNMPTKTLF